MDISIVNAARSVVRWQRDLRKQVVDRLLDLLPRQAKHNVANFALNLLPEISYRRLAERGFKPGGIVDVGAYRGDWTRLARLVFDTVPVLMIEPQQSKAQVLQHAQDSMIGVEFEAALLADVEGATKTFHEMESGSSFYP